MIHFFLASCKITSHTSWDSLDSSPVVLGAGAGFTGDSRCPRKLLNEKSATSEVNHWESLSLRSADGLCGSELSDNNPKTV